MGHHYYDDVAMMYHFYFDYLQHQLGVVLHGLRIEIYPCTRECDILRLIDPILIDTVISIEDLFLSSADENPSIHPRFSIIVSLEESAVDLLVQELAIADSYSLCCDHMRLVPNTNLLGQPMLVHITDGFLSADDANLDPVIQTLREECPRNLHENSASILHYHTMSVITTIDALFA